MIPYEEAVKELTGLARLCNRSGSADGASRLRGAIEITAVIYEVLESDVRLDLRAELLLEGIDLPEE